LLYEYKLGHNASEAARNICRGIGKGAVSTATACRWFNSFRNKDYSLEDDQRSGRPTEIDLSELKQIIESDPSLSQLDVLGRQKSNEKIFKFFSTYAIKDYKQHIILIKNGSYSVITFKLKSFKPIKIDIF
jgi:hypothetical protein